MMCLGFINPRNSGLSWQKILWLRKLVYILNVIYLLLRLLRAPQKVWLRFLLVWRRPLQSINEVHICWRWNDRLRLDPDTPIRLLWLRLIKEPRLSRVLTLSWSLVAGGLLLRQILQICHSRISIVKLGCALLLLIYIHHRRLFPLKQWNRSVRL